MATKRPAAAGACKKQKSGANAAAAMKWAQLDNDAVEVLSDLAEEAKPADEEEKVKKKEKEKQKEEKKKGQQPKKKGRGKKAENMVKAGYDKNGEALPTDDTSGLTKYQHNVWKKTAEKLPRDAREAFEKADKKEQHKMQNSLIPKDANYAMSVNFEESGEEWWSRVVHARERKSQSTINLGMTETEILGKLGNSIDALQKGIARKDIVVKGNFYYWQRKQEMHTKEVEDSTKLGADGDASNPEVRHNVQSRINELQWCSWATDVMQMNIKDSNTTSASDNVLAGEQAWDMVQEAYDAISTCVGRCKELCKHLVRTCSSSKSDTSKRLVADASAAIKEMELGISEFDDIMVADVEQVTETQLRSLVKKFTPAFEKITEYEGELKALKKQKAAKA
jgi:hypothetical protein